MLRCASPTKPYRKNSRAVPLPEIPTHNQVATWMVHEAGPEAGAVDTVVATAVVAEEDEEEVVVAEEEAVGNHPWIRRLRCVYDDSQKVQLTTALCELLTTTALSSDCTTERGDSEDQFRQ